MTEIYFHNVGATPPDMPQHKIKFWIAELIANEGYTYGNINFIFCSDNYIKNLNNTYLKHNDTTDVLSFDYSEKKHIEADIFIGINCVKRNAMAMKNSFMEELLRVMAHGILHLMGYTDKQDADVKQMRSKEDYYLSLFF